MKDKHISLPDQRNYEHALAQAYEIACEELARAPDIEQKCRQSGAQYLETDSQKLVVVRHLNRSYQITLPDIDVRLISCQEEVPLKTKVLILHYLTRAKGTTLTNKTITFKELPEGAIYFPTFAKRTLNPLVSHFGKEPHRLLDMAENLGGYKADYGDVAVTISAFEYVPVTLVLWRGDEEFAPRGSLIFDANISDYLSTEDIIVVCETIIWKLVRALKPG